MWVEEKFLAWITGEVDGRFVSNLMLGLDMFRYVQGHRSVYRSVFVIRKTKAGNKDLGIFNLEMAFWSH